MTHRILTVLLVALPLVVQAATVPTNINSRLAAAIRASEPGAKASSLTTAKTSALRPAPLVTDSEQRVLVDIYLNGKASLASVESRITGSGGKITGDVSWYRNGLVSAYLPLGKITGLATSGVVQSIFSSSRPRTHVGKVTSQGVQVTGADAVQALGITGKGITVGVLSDSYDTAALTLTGKPLKIHAADDVASGDLPGKGNPLGQTKPVRVLQDDTYPGDADYVFDEGRALLQVVHDMAPDAALAFATADYGEAAFANNIMKLRTIANADVIVDDVGYYDEPYYSDGVIAQTVDKVSTTPSSIMPGKKVLYFSSAGNGAGGSYDALFSPITAKAATSAKALGNLDLTQVPPGLYSGGFHNFGTKASPYVVLNFTLPAGSDDVINLFWNDPQLLPGGATTDYNILVFDSDGNYIPDLSGTDDNFATENPYDYAEIYAETATSMQIVVCRAGDSPAIPVARRIHLNSPDEAVPDVNIFGSDAPDTYGHPCAQNALGVAAWAYSGAVAFEPIPGFLEPLLESFSSPGPDAIYFDANGNRLTSPDVRKKPDISAPDGVDTTFFGDSDPDHDKFPNFFGTSCAAPHAAGLAALLLQKAGGPGTLSTDQVRTLLAETADTVHFKSLTMITGTSSVDSTGNQVMVTAVGDSNSSNDPNFFRINYLGQPNSYLYSVSITLTPAGEKFDSTTATGFPFTLGSLTTLPPSAIKPTVPRQNPSFSTVTLVFEPGAFRSTDTVAFGVDRDLISTGAGGNTASFLEGATFRAETSNGPVTGTLHLQQVEGYGYERHVGYGLIDAAAAAARVPVQ